MILLTAQVKRKALGGVKLVYSLLQAVAGTFAFCKTAQLSKGVSMSTAIQQQINLTSDNRVFYNSILPLYVLFLKYMVAGYTNISSFDKNP